MGQRRTQARRHDERTPPRWQPYLKWAAVLLLVVAPTAMALIQSTRWLVDPATFPVRSVRVEGDFQYLVRTELQQAVNEHVGSGLLWVDVEAVRRGVESLAWVQRASVRRIWPEGLVVHVTEQQPYAKWVPGGLVNSEGTVFAAATGTGPVGLPEFNGPPGLSAVVTQRYREFASLVAESGSSVQSIELDERNAWRVQLSSGVTLDLGREDVSRRLARFARYYTSVLTKEQRAVTRVDLRYANGFAVEFSAPPLSSVEHPENRQSGLLKGDLADAKKV